MAVDRLHDCYVRDRFRSRQPSPGDTWIVDGLAAALRAGQARRPDVDVADGVRTATRRLRAIASAVGAAGDDTDLYRRGLDRLAGRAPDVDLSDPGGA